MIDFDYLKKKYRTANDSKISIERVKKMEITNLSKIYKNQTVLSIDDLEIKKGSITALIGENGAGKTTLFKILSKLTMPTTGEIDYQQEDDRFGILIESPAIDLGMTAKENLMWATKLYGIDDEKEIERILDVVNLKSGNKKARAFSLGMKQRLGIAMSLIHNPDVLILDEPMNGLDPTGVRELRDILLGVNKQGTTIIISSHILEEVYKIATDYIFIKKGEIIKTISLEEMSQDEKYNYYISTSDDTRMQEILKNDLKIDFDTKQNYIYINLTDDKVLNFSKYLAEHHIYIMELTRKKFSIEEYYMEMMENEEHNSL